jgi:hypothetical protein
MPEGIVQQPDVLPEGAGMIIILPPRSITALTSLPPGDLNLPEKLSLKRSEVLKR